MLQLPFGVLIEAADSDMANALLLQEASSTRKCQKEIYCPSTHVLINLKNKLILVFRSGLS